MECIKFGERNNEAIERVFKWTHAHKIVQVESVAMLMGKTNRGNGKLQADFGFSQELLCKPPPRKKYRQAFQALIAAECIGNLITKRFRFPPDTNTDRDSGAIIFRIFQREIKAVSNRFP